MLEKVSAYIEHHQLLPEKGSIVVAVSGGADSLCLLDLLRQICGPNGRFPAVSLQAAHLDHMLRGGESAREARIVAELLKSWDIECTSGAFDVLALARDEKRSLEEAARLARYRFLREVADGRPIAVGHHADDQVETLLLHWLRGSGLTGQVGMPPRQQDIIRPLLEVTHAETVAYCQEHGIIPLEDQSNSDPRFLRNRLRHELLPLLQNLNPGIQRTLLRNAEVARVDLSWLETQIDQCWPEIVLLEEEYTIQLNIPPLLALPLSLQRHLLRRVSAQLCAGQSPLEIRHLWLIEQLLQKHLDDGQERLLDLPQRLQVQSRGTSLTLTRLVEPVTLREKSAGLDTQSSEILLSIPGTVQVPGTRWQARAEIVSPPLLDQVITALQQENWSAVWQLLEPVTPNAVYIDSTSSGSHLLIRTRRPGDRIQPLGMGSQKKVQDIFTDKHIGRTERATLPLFFSAEKCLWVAGACLDHSARLTPKTRQIMRLSIQPL